MTRIDFYILPDTDPQARWLFGCRLIEKALGHHKPIYVHTQSRDEALYLDQLLWAFRADSFLPHDFGQERLTAKPAPIHIGYGDQQPPDHHHEVLINFAEEIPTFFSRFERVAEVISQDEATKTKARQRYTFYRDRGYPLHNHDMRKPSEV